MGQRRNCDGYADDQSPSETIDLPYLRTLWRPDQVVELALRDWPDVQAWAHEFSLGGYTEPTGQTPAPVDDAYTGDEAIAANGRSVYAGDAL